MTQAIQEKMRMATRTPFTQQASGEWLLILVAGYSLEWGHRFDADVGYRVYLKFAESINANVIPGRTAHIWANNITKNETRSEILMVAKALHDCGRQVEHLNKLWAEKGAQDVPLDVGVPHGHA